MQTEIMRDVLRFIMWYNKEPIIHIGQKTFHEIVEVNYIHTDSYSYAITKNTKLFGYDVIVEDFRLGYFLT